MEEIYWYLQNYYLLLRNLFIITKKSDKLVKLFGNVCDNQMNLAIFIKFFGYIK